MKKEEIYVINQPKHILLSVVVVDCDLPLTQDVHENINELRSISDVLFVFSDRFQDINKKKFTALYECCGYIESTGNIGRTVMKAMIYGKEIFEKHIGFTVGCLSSLRKSGFSGKLQTLLGSSISQPVFKLRRLSSEEYYEIYKEKRTCFLCNKENVDNMFCSYTTDSMMMFFRARTIDILFDFMNSNKDVVDSFKKTDPRFFYASLIKFLNIELVDKNLEDVEI